MKSKNQYRSAEILLRCSKPEHDNCSVMGDALLKKFKNVLEANTTRTKIGNVTYCVAASGFVKNGEIKKFQNELKNLRIESPELIKVRYSKIYLSKH